MYAEDQHEEPEMTTQFTKKPWEHRRWRGGVARGNLGWAAFFHFFMSLLFLGVAVGIAVKMPRAFLFAMPGKDAWVPGAFGWMFAVIGLCGFSWALIALARWWRFGRCRVPMTTIPGVIGGHFTGEVELPDSLPADAEVRLELLCEVTYYTPGSRSDDHGTTSISTEWAYKVCTRPADRQYRNRQLSVPFDFTIPYKTDMLASLHDETNDTRNTNGTSIKYQWHLRVTAKLPGADLDIKFRVPVFKTEASDPTLDQVPEAGAELPLEQYLAMKDEKRRVRVEGGPRGPVFVGAVMPVMWAIVLPIGIFGAVFTAVGIGVPILTISEFNHEIHIPKSAMDALGMLLPLLFVIIPSLIGLVFFVIGALLSMATLGSFVARRTWVERGNLCQSRTFFGIPLPTRTEPCGMVASVGTGGGSSSNGKSFATVVVHFRRKDGGVEQRGLQTMVRRTISGFTGGTDIPTRRETQELIAALRGEINRQRSIPLTEDGEDTEDDDKNQRSA